MAIGADSTAGQRPAKYPGEDTTPTSKREIWGWYAYGIAAEVFAVCGVGKVDLLYAVYQALKELFMLIELVFCKGPSCR